MRRDYKVKDGIVINLQSLLKFAIANSAYVAFKAPQTIVGNNVILTLPESYGSANQILSTNATGNLFWVDQTSPGSGNLDGGIPSSNYGGITPVYGGTP